MSDSLWAVIDNFDVSHPGAVDGLGLVDRATGGHVINAPPVRLDEDSPLNGHWFSCLRRR